MKHFNFKYAKCNKFKFSNFGHTFRFKLKWKCATIIAIICLATNTLKNYAFVHCSLSKQLKIETKKSSKLKGSTFNVFHFEIEKVFFLCSVEQNSKHHWTMNRSSLKCLIKNVAELSGLSIQYTGYKN